MVPRCRRCGQTHDAYTGCTLAGRVAGRPTVIGEDEALVGNVVADRYQIGDVLGVGSTGTVFAVEHLTFARPAAMKVLRPRFADADLVSRVFHGEARAAWSVSHACLCEVFDIGTLPDGAPFFVMERLEGETLAARIARERLSLASAVDVMMQLLSAVAAVHARDLLLRDLRPQNLFLVHRRGCRPLLKILDFGLARLTPLDRIQDEWDALRAAGGPSDGVGSTSIPYYLSPERTRGEHGIEPASDLFVAAVIFYEALTGERPFVSSSFNGVLVQVAQGRPPPLHEHRPDLPAELSAFMTRALSANARLRPASAKDMQDELRAIFEGARRGGSTTPSAAATPGTEPPRGDEHSSTFSSMNAAPAGFLASLAPPAPRAPARTESAPPNGPPPTAPPRQTARPRFAPYEPIASSPGLGAPRERDPVDHDEQETQRRALAAEALGGPTGRRSSPEQAAHFDDNNDRTMPPSLEHETALHASSEASSDDAAERTMELRERGNAPPDPQLALGIAEDEETETMPLTPELRARVEQLMASRPAPRPAPLPHPAPPPAQRGKPPHDR
ncbi:MAG: serine/threonine protein kinase [Labilithrix sp.]|nr:serine/threonine protein kinase [Labilithrix sp.]